MVSIIFAFINFFIFLALLVYFFKHYILSFLDSSINEEKAYIDGLGSQYKHFKNMESQLNKSIESQGQYIDSLKQKSVLWAQSIKSQEEKAETEKKEQLEIINKKREEQSRYYILSKAERLASPLIKDKLKEDLKEYFRDRSHQLDYLSNIERSLGQAKLDK